METQPENRNGPAGPRRPRSDILTAQETAEWIRIPLKTIYELAKTGRMPARRVGKQYRFNRKAVLEWLQGSRNGVALTR
jgi:excisionase family DNA binding protein